MPIYLLTATDEKGKRDTHRVDAENSQDAYQQYESQGFTDIVLHSDDAAAAASALFPPNPDVEEHFTAADMVELQFLTSFQFFLFMLRKAYWQMRWFLIIIIGVSVYRWMRTHEVSEIDYLIFVCLGLPIVISFWVAYFSPRQKYDKMLHAFSWGRWQEVLDQVPRLRGKIPDFELTGREAVAVAALGNFDQALEMMDHFVDSPEVPRWMYLGRLSELYEVAKDYDQVVECLRLSYEDAPENPTVVIDYAYGLLKYGNDNSLANKLLEDAEQQHMGELIELLILYFKGIFELNLGNLRVAESHFLKCQTGLLPIAPSQPLLQLFVDLNRAYLAITLAKIGEREQAEEIYQLALPRLKALDSELIMNRYAEAIA
ncbi:hypothetical protein [uncultured Gimesia sp.]|uniref:hypothetical protein n=1 Tax=uncultured Gimesia sp. TaxID=1678688 RepID=UPI002614BF74|nr:hypothetical protein [uncultured Gimesia sp.]